MNMDSQQDHINRLERLIQELVKRIEMLELSKTLPSPYTLPPQIPTPHYPTPQYPTPYCPTPYYPTMYNKYKCYFCDKMVGTNEIHNCTINIG